MRVFVVCGPLLTGLNCYVRSDLSSATCEFNQLARVSYKLCRGRSAVRSLESQS